MKPTAGELNRMTKQKAYDVGYMARTREFYRAQGYTNDYQWAHYEQRPFTPLPRPLERCMLGVITTAMPDTEQGRSNREVYALKSDPIPASMYTAELSWDKGATHTDDVGSFLPLEALNAACSEGWIGATSPRFYTLPTEYSKRRTLEKDAPEILRRCREDAVDIALLVPL